MIPYDLHTHTTFSDGSHSVETTVKFAEAVGLEAVAITDHFTPKSRLVDEEGLLDRYLDEIARASRQAEVLVLRGVEATLLDVKGGVSISEEVFSRVDVVLADLSGHTEGILRNPPASRRQLLANLTKCLIHAMSSPFFHILAHPFNLGRLPDPIEPVDLPRCDLEEIAAAMRENGKIFEIMNCTFWWFPQMPVRRFTEQYIEMVQLFAKAGILFSLGSDDHRTGVGNLGWSHRVLRAINVPEEQIVDPRVHFRKPARTSGQITGKGLEKTRRENGTSRGDHGKAQHTEVHRAGGLPGAD